MSCCGKSTNHSIAQTSSQPRVYAPATRGGDVADGSVTFEYIGDSGLTAIGSVTRKRYIFTAPGVRVSVDRRDFESLLHIPVLRYVR
jgi:hypothetical protein